MNHFLRIPFLLFIVGSFTTASASINILGPNGGEFYVEGEYRHIGWNKTGSTAATVIIDLSIDNGVSWTSLGAPNNTGIFALFIPNTPSTQCLIRIDDGTSMDVSDSTFTISANPASVNDISYVNRPTIYSNSVTNKITIASNDYPITTVAIYDMTGKKIVGQKCLTEMNTEIDIAPFSEGIYIVEVDGNGIITRQKLLIVKF